MVKGMDGITLMAWVHMGPKTTRRQKMDLGWRISFGWVVDLVALSLFFDSYSFASLPLLFLDVFFWSILLIF
jgi:hypothetical protein